MKNQYNNPFYVVFYGCLIIDETSLENLVDNSIQEILRNKKFTSETVAMVINFLTYVS